MKKIIFLIFSACMLLALTGCPHRQATANTAIAEESDYAHRQSINIFTITYEKNTAFISLSEIYPISDENDALTIPGKTDKGYTEERYVLTLSYRDRFFAKTGITETDSVYIYDYARNQLISFPVSDLQLIARLSLYADSTQTPFTVYDYQVGFEFDRKVFSHLTSALVYVGPENPFAQEQLALLVWDKVSAEALPANHRTPGESLSGARESNLSLGDTYLAKANYLHYFLQDYLLLGEIRARRLLVIEPRTQEAITEVVFTAGEMTTFAPLNGQDEFVGIQWAGKLFKHKPPVVFGFIWPAFGCPGISFVDPSSESITLLCDNRH